MTDWLKKIFFIILAIILLAMSVNLFLAPHHIAAGGLTGLAIILETLLHLDRSIIVLIGNVLVLILTFVFLGKEIFLNTVIGAFLLPVIMGLVPHITLINDTMLSMITGSVLFGVGVAILYNNNASSGGTAVPPLILKKYFNINPSIGLFFTDCIVVILSLLVFDRESFFFAIFSIFITSATLRYIESGFNKKKVVFILSEKKDAILNDILHEVNRGVTVIPVTGGYTGTQTEMLMVTLASKDYQQLIKIVDGHDKKAFMITNTVSDVHGLGFTYESGSV
jgi:uncharacterized membrane-anchored protein YitT (DUF2179 family)